MDPLPGITSFDGLFVVCGLYPENRHETVTCRFLSHPVFVDGPVLPGGLRRVRNDLVDVFLLHGFSGPVF